MPQTPNEPKKAADQKIATRGGGEIRLSKEEIASREAKTARQMAKAKADKPAGDAALRLEMEDDELSAPVSGRPVIDLDKELGGQVPPDSAPEPIAVGPEPADGEWNGFDAQTPPEIDFGVPKVVTSLRKFINDLVERIEDAPQSDVNSVVTEAMSQAILIPGSVKPESPDKILELYGRDKQTSSPLLEMLGHERAELAARALLKAIETSEAEGRYLSRNPKEFMRNPAGQLPEHVSKAQLQEGCDNRASAIAQLLIANQFRVRSRISHMFTDRAAGLVAPGYGEKLLALFDRQELATLFRHKIEDEIGA